MFSAQIWDKLTVLNGTKPVQEEELKLVWRRWYIKLHFPTHCCPPDCPVLHPNKPRSSFADEIAFGICVFSGSEVIFYLDCEREVEYLESNVVKVNRKDLKAELWGTGTCSWDSGFHCGTLASPSSVQLPTVAGAPKQRGDEVKELRRDKWKIQRWRGNQASASSCFLDSLSYDRIHHAREGSRRVREFSRRKTTRHCVLLWLATGASAGSCLGPLARD